MKSQLLLLGTKSPFSIKVYPMRYPFAELYNGGGEYVLLNSNTNPFGPSPLALRSIQENISKINLYPSREEHRRLKELITLKLKEEGIEIEPKKIVLGNGSDEAIDFVLRFVSLKFGKPKVIVGEKTFAFYEYCARTYGLDVIKAPLKDFGYDLSLMLELASKNRPCILMICNPINPTGRIIPWPELESFLNELPENTNVLVDEAYFEFSFFLNGKDWRKNEYRSALHLSLKDPSKIFVTRTFSKAYGLAGIRLGYLICQFSEDIEDAISPPFNVNYLALKAGEGALMDKDFLKRTLENNLDGLRILESIEGTVPSWANFVLIKLKNTSTYHELRRQKILVRDMTQYGFEGFIRVSVGKLYEMEKFMEIFRKTENK